MPLLDVILGYDCNLWCDYCTITAAMRTRSLTPAAVVAAMVQGRRDGFDRLSITGGEPTIFAHLLPIVRRARRLGYVEIKVQSNGLLWAQTANVARAVEAGVSSFSVSIHSHSRARYESIVQRADTYDAMVCGLTSLVSANVPLSADVIVMRDTLDELADSVAWLDTLGISRVQLWFVSLTDGNADNLDSMPSMTEALPAMRAAFAEGRRRGMTVRSLHVPRCLLGDDAGHAFDPAAEGVRVVTPEATFDLSRSRLAGQVHVAACRGCIDEAICPGLREDYLARFGDAEVAKARDRPSVRPGAVRLPIV
ncbi:MAG: radical SAM protein [Nannocystaceae bacterium]|nr:radical SAM protein [Nannocystaceae bacterium]